MSSENKTPQLEVGDLAFILMGPAVFRKLAKDTGSWTNHVGIVVDVSGKEPMIAESKFPFSTIRPLSKFVASSKNGKIEVRRFKLALAQHERETIVAAAHKRLGIFYDAGFNLGSKRQFCSRFVWEVLNDSGRDAGKVKTLRELRGENPQSTLIFWQLWYFGMIPWERKTITPASLLCDDRLFTVMRGERGKYSVHLP